jgi:hypothetical protein
MNSNIEIYQNGIKCSKISELDGYHFDEIYPSKTLLKLKVTEIDKGQIVGVKVHTETIITPDPAKNELRVRLDRFLNIKYFTVYQLRALPLEKIVGDTICDKYIIHFHLENSVPFLELVLFIDKVQFFQQLSKGTDTIA